MFCLYGCGTEMVHSKNNKNQLIAEFYHIEQTEEEKYRNTIENKIRGLHDQY